MQASLTLTNHSLVPRVPLLPFSLLLRGKEKRETGYEVETKKKNMRTTPKRGKKHANKASLFIYKTNFKVSSVVCISQMSLFPYARSRIPHS